MEIEKAKHGQRVVYKKNVSFSLCVCVYTGSGEGSDLQVHPKLPQTGSGGWTSLERCRGGDEKKKQKVRV